MHRWISILHDAHCVFSRVSDWIYGTVLNKTFGGSKLALNLQRVKSPRTTTRHDHVGTAVFVVPAIPLRPRS